MNDDFNYPQTIPTGVVPAAFPEPDDVTILKALRRDIKSRLFDRIAEAEVRVTRAQSNIQKARYQKATDEIHSKRGVVEAQVKFEGALVQWEESQAGLEEAKDRHALQRALRGMSLDVQKIVLGEEIEKEMIQLKLSQIQKVRQGLEPMSSLQSLNSLGHDNNEAEMTPHLSDGEIRQLALSESRVIASMPSGQKEEALVECEQRLKSEHKPFPAGEIFRLVKQFAGLEP